MSSAPRSPRPRSHPPVRTSAGAARTSRAASAADGGEGLLHHIEPRLDPELARYRDDDPILAATTYMNSNSMGAMPRAARDALQSYCDAWQREGVEAWHPWSELVDAVGDGAARFFKGTPGCTSLNQNVAFFEAAIASAIDWSGPRNKVVVEALQFHTRRGRESAKQSRGA